MKRRDEVAIAVFGTWMVTGLYVDGWAHANNKPETFFTPWHLILYSGFGAGVAYFAITGFLQPSRERAFDKLVAIGFGLFVAGAIGDFAWHQVFGIEVNIEALLSPTHLGLMTGGLLMVSGPIRSAMQRPGDDSPSLRSFFPTLVCLTLSAAVVSFFLQYVSAYRWGGLVQNDDEEFFNVMLQSGGIASVLITNLVIMAVVLLALRRWRTPPGTFTIMFGTLAAGMAAMTWWGLYSHAIAALLAGAFADYLVFRLRPSPERPAAMRWFSGLVPLVLWSLWLVALSLMVGVQWPVEIWTGIVILAVLEGIGLSILAFPSKPVVVTDTPPPIEPVRELPLEELLEERT